MTISIKAEFGKRLRMARDARRLSRTALGQRLGVSPKTIQSWEMGRTFLEKLSIIPRLEMELDISVSDLIARATRQGDESKFSPKHVQSSGPLPVHINLQVIENIGVPVPEKLAGSFVAVPLLKPGSATRPIKELTSRDILEHVIVPAEWVPRGGILVAYRMRDSGMRPMIPLGGVVVVDRKSNDLSKSMGRVVALNLHKRGLRIRRLTKDHESGTLMAMPCIESGRGKARFKPEDKDSIIGRVVGVFAQPV